MSGAALDLHAITDGKAATSGVAHAEALVAFAEALVGEDETALDLARARVLEAVGPDGLVDAAAVASNFERMVRIADSTGIPLDAPVHVLSADLRADLGIDAFASARNTPGGGATRRALGQLLRPAMRGALRLVGAVRKRRP